MSISIRPLDITKLKCDVIFNSLGVTTTSYGQICRNIVKKANSGDLVKEIASWNGKAEPGVIYLTDGYDLPCKKIIHIVTPYFKYDNELFGLEYVYKVALLTAYKKGYKKIGVPIIGTGANGYPHAYVLKMLTKLLQAFDENYHGLKITLCMPLYELEPFDDFVDPSKIENDVKNYFAKNNIKYTREFYFDRESFEYLESYDVNRYLEFSAGILHENLYYGGNRGERHIKQGQLQDELDILLKTGKRPVKVDMFNLVEKSVTFYIDTYINNRFSDEEQRKIIRQHTNEIIAGDKNSTSLKSKHGIEDKRSTISKSMLMRYILGLHMTMEEAQDLLCFCGKTFSPIDKCDLVFKEFINNEIYDVYEVNGYCIKRKIEPIFAYAL